jgi:hypothetical protein
MPCWLHSKQQAEHRDALEVLSNGAERQSGGATHGEHKQHTARGTSGGLASAALGQLLERNGYTHVLHYVGGLQEWEQAGYLLEGEWVKKQRR